MPRFASTSAQRSCSTRKLFFAFMNDLAADAGKAKREGNQ
jgi:hypothetical protein